MCCGLTQQLAKHSTVICSTLPLLQWDWERTGEKKKQSRTHALRQNLFTETEKEEKKKQDNNNDSYIYKTSDAQAVAQHPLTNVQLVPKQKLPTRPTPHHFQDF